MKTRFDPWLLLCDHRRARLVCVDLSEHGTLRLRETDAMEDHQPEHEHGRPMALSSRDAGDYASVGDDVREHERRHIDDVVHWSRHMAASYDIERLIIFSPAKLLGLLRQVWPKHLVKSVELVQGEFATMRLTDLHRHPTICEALGCGAHPR